MRLLQVGVPVKHLIYGGAMNSVQHNDFVFAWRPLPFPFAAPPGAPAGPAADGDSGGGGGGIGAAAAAGQELAAAAASGGGGEADPYLEGLLPFSRDLLLILLGRVRVRFLTTPPGVSKL
jgi:hypothetical protein